MSTYNVYANRQAGVGESVPVWLGVVSPIPAGAKLDPAFAKAGAFIPAGSPMALKDGIATPFSGFVVKAYAVSGDNSVITVVPFGGASAPKVGDMLMKLGDTFSAVGKAWNPSAVAVNADDNSAYDITVATEKIDVVSEGDILSFSSSESEGSAKSLSVEPSYYSYNDVAIDPVMPGETESNIEASVALVNFHGEGILINRTPSAIVKKQMRAAVPNVIADDRF